MPFRVDIPKPCACRMKTLVLLTSRGRFGPAATHKDIAAGGKERHDNENNANRPEGEASVFAPRGC